MGTCLVCEPGYLLSNDGLSCQLESNPPIINNTQRTLSISFDVAVPLQVYDVEAVRGYRGAGALTYSTIARRGADADKFSLDNATGALMLVAPLDSDEQVTLTVRVSDEQASCTFARDDITISLDDGCYSDLYLTFNIVKFVDDSADVIEYISPTETSVNVTWNPPQLASRFSTLSLSNNLGLQQPSAEFSAGVTLVRYETDPLDVGGPLIWEFRVFVEYGRQLQVSAIGVVSNATASVYYILDGDRMSGDALPIPPIASDEANERFAMGLISPVSQPFTFANVPTTSMLDVMLTWCIPGRTWTNDLYVASAARVSLSDGSVLTDHGSGYTSDGGCIRIKARNDFPLEGLSFAAMDIALNTSVSGFSANPTKILQPLEGSHISATAANWTQDEDYLVLEDIVPPSFGSTCPAAVSLQALEDQTTVIATWSQPIATDNVGIVALNTNLAPGDKVSFFDSPLLVTSTARDSNDLTTKCEFEVSVDVPTSPFIVATSMAYSSNPDERIDFTVHGASGRTPSRVEYALAPRLPAIVLNLSAFNQLIFEYNMARDGDRMFIRSAVGANYAVLAFELLYLDDALSEMPAVLLDDNVKVELEIVGMEHDGNVLDNDALSSYTVLRTAQVVLSASEGLISIRAKSASFRQGFSFQSLRLVVTYPTSRPDGAFTVYAPLDQSGVYVELYMPSVIPSFNDLEEHPRVLLLDNVPPSVDSCPSNQSITLASDTNTVNASWSMPLFSDARGIVARTGPSATSSTVALLPPGADYAPIVYTARDLFGNLAKCSFTYSLIDAYAPDANFVTNLTMSLPANGSVAIITPEQWLPSNMRDNSGFAVRVVSPDPQDVLQVELQGAEYTITIADVYGNERSEKLTVHVQDTTPPVVRCPSLNPVVAQRGSAEAVVQWDLVEPTDNFAMPTYTLTHNSGDVFPVGTTEVTLRAIDNSNNIASCRFNVVVEPREGTALDSNDSSNAVITGAGSGSAVLVLLVIGLVLLLMRSRAEHRKPLNWEEVFAMIDQLKEKSGDEVVAPRELARSQVNLLGELGMGAFGVVYKGLLIEGRGMPDYLVAVKSLHAMGSNGDRTELLEEAAVMAQFSHPNVISLIGVVTVGKPLLVVQEFAELGSLKEYIQTKNAPAATRLLFAGDIAAGLQHVNSKGFVHRDVAARNVLVSSLERCKIADFGMARDTSEDVQGGASYYRSRGGQLPVRWSAPEALEDRKFTEKSDVWSYGVVLYELYSDGTMPFEGWHNQKVWVKVCAGHRLEQPDGCGDDVYGVMSQCWAAKPEDRPGFAKLMLTFRTMYTDLTGNQVEMDDDINVASTRDMNPAVGMFRQLMNKHGVVPTDAHPSPRTRNPLFTDSSDFDEPLSNNYLTSGPDDDEYLDVDTDKQADKHAGKEAALGTAQADERRLQPALDDYFDVEDDVPSKPAMPIDECKYELKKLYSNLHDVWHRFGPG
eukprot:TRINITY_DN12443_c0_g1_i9.p1 TRINITY_DN12443_c0_g1~~TRINITY_DN12443_c0_g1_i9.p1  ORF type:complete len:1632 (+),score=285.35 TRINITY_DN12443_c0_g1_i9:557-4897(+)